MYIGPTCCHPMSPTRNKPLLPKHPEEAKVCACPAQVASVWANAASRQAPPRCRPSALSHYRARPCWLWPLNILLSCSIVLLASSPPQSSVSVNSPSSLMLFLPPAGRFPFLAHDTSSHHTQKHKESGQMTAGRLEH